MTDNNDFSVGHLLERIVEGRKVVLCVLTFSQVQLVCVISSFAIVSYTMANVIISRVDTMALITLKNPHRRHVRLHPMS